MKSLLCAYCTELNRDWEEGLPWVLLAVHEVIQESMGFSHNDLVFGHKVCGPLAVLQGNLENSEPIRQYFYRVSPEKGKCLEPEVTYLLDHGLARPPSSWWASPCLLASKPDGTYRLCTDYRKLKSIY